MHELGLVRDIVDVVVASAVDAGAVRVKCVTVRIGQARDIVPSILDCAFSYLTKGTVAEGAELVVTQVPVTARCKECGRVFPLDIFDSDSWSCPACGSAQYRLHTGREFSIDSIEVVRDKACVPEAIPA